jgi:NAD(P)-dependent dehydrogenase (short-subunit alcohol dehydrogenase family)
MSRFQGKSVVISGAGQGIGLGMAELADTPLAELVVHTSASRRSTSRRSRSGASRSRWT